MFKVGSGISGILSFIPQIKNNRETAIYVRVSVYISWITQAQENSFFQQDKKAYRIVRYDDLFQNFYMDFDSNMYNETCLEHN